MANGPCFDKFPLLMINPSGPEKFCLPSTFGKMFIVVMRIFENTNQQSNSKILTVGVALCRSLGKLVIRISIHPIQKETGGLHDK